MVHMKKVFAILLAAMISLSIAACGKKILLFLRRFLQHPSRSCGARLWSACSIPETIVCPIPIRLRTMRRSSLLRV